jgi:predicted permease
MPPEPRLLARELTVSARRLRRLPGYSATVIATTALTMALATAVFTIVDGVLFKPLPYERAGELFHVSGGYSDELRSQNPSGVSNRFGLGVSILDAREMEAAVPGVRVAVYGGASAQERYGDLRAWAPAAASVDRHLLEVLGARPLLGGFTGDDFNASPEAVAAALLTYRAWQARFGGRADIVGEILEAGPSRRYRVAGVLPATFLYPSSGAQPDLLTPLIAAPEEPATRRRSYQAVARVPPGVPAADVQARFDEVARASREVIPDRQANGGMGPVDVWALRLLSNVLGGNQQPTFRFVFLAAMALVLLGCVNVSGLVASRGLDRSREISLRRALGAGRGDIASLIVSELALLIGAGTVIGVAASRPAVSIAVSLLPPNVGLLREPALDPRVVAFAAAATVISVALVSLWPLRQTRRARAVFAISAASPTATAPQSAGRFVVVSLQVALGFVLTLAGALIAGSLVRIWQTDVGYPTERLLLVEGTVDAGDASARQVALDGFLDAVRRMPGVIGVGATSGGLLRGSMPGGMWPANTYAVTDGFFEAVPIRVIDGRLPTNEELRSRIPAAAINEIVAAHYFPDRPAVGQELREEGGNRNAFTVVGVVAYARFGGWAEEPAHGQVYIPLADARRFSAAVRSGPSAGPVLQRMLELAGDWPVALTTAASAEDLLHETVRAQRFQGWLFSAFAVAALAVVCVGVLGLMATTTARRSRELAIRLALGARPASLQRLMLREQLAPLVTGLVAGLVGSIWIAASLRAYLYGTTPYDPALWALAAFAIAVVAGAGVLIPARRATRLDPARVLRTE